MMTDWTYAVEVSLFWRPDTYGNPGRALYVRGLYIGEVVHLPAHPGYSDRPWRAWLMTSDEGDAVGWYATEQEAKNALLDAALKALLP